MTAIPVSYTHLDVYKRQGFTVKHGRGGAISFLVPGQERATRLRASTLGDGYDPEEMCIRDRSISIT